jgi:hypothetical protein
VTGEGANTSSCEVKIQQMGSPREWGKESLKLTFAVGDLVLEERISLSFARTCSEGKSLDGPPIGNEFVKCL